MKIQTMLDHLAKIGKVPNDNDIINEDQNYIYTNLLQGELFKGHKFNLTFQRHGDQKIGALGLTQSYFGGAVHSTYYIDNNESIITYQVHNETPKWLGTKLFAIHKLLTANRSTHLPNWHPGDVSLTLIEKNPKINIWSSSYTLEYIIRSSGFAFTGHRDNINELKKLTEFFKILRDKLKKCTVQQIALECYPHEQKLITENVLTLKSSFI